MPRLTIPVNEKDHIQGSSTAPVTLVEYGDYQCDICKMSAPVIRQLQQELGDQLLFVFRHFPLKQAHPLAQLAAEAVEAASQQNKFWEMHFLLFEKQRYLNSDFIFALAKGLQLDMDKFGGDMHSLEIQKRIESDFQSGIRSGVNGTPCFFINEERYDGDASYNAFKQALIKASYQAKK